MTYREANLELLRRLLNAGWQVNSLLKTPTATKPFAELPTGHTVVLLFKPQSIHIELRRPHSRPESLSLFLDAKVLVEAGTEKSLAVLTRVAFETAKLMNERRS